MGKPRPACRAGNALVTKGVNVHGLKRIHAGLDYDLIKKESDLIMTKVMLVSRFEKFDPKLPATHSTDLEEARGTSMGCALHNIYWWFPTYLILQILHHHRSILVFFTCNNNVSTIVVRLLTLTCITNTKITPFFTNLAPSHIFFYSILPTFTMTDWTIINQMSAKKTCLNWL